MSATLARERFDVAAGRDDAEVVAQPLHERAGDRDRAFERVVRGLLAELIGDGGHEAAADETGFVPVFISRKQPVP